MKQKQFDDHQLVAPTAGEIVPITAVPDAVFAQKMMGDGYAVIPSADQVVAPINGHISFIAATKHGIGITGDTGVELIVHLGIDTVTLNGAPFDVMVKLNQAVSAGQPIVTMNRQVIAAAKLNPIVIVALTNLAEIKQQLTLTPGSVNAGDLVATLD
ncbi:PTS sugar transporter subunit IIA [Lactiplantibacillus pingfangensis]|uniref:PTS sugar transporter subunit IIA n=1 Tax=Lactiplantibacillus pingfangensis TaxID=2559915 RepID=UPI0014858F93|nr:PTS glucose transporter subunit IIA [Lactiplantibacillus pingfangensis]